MRHADTCTIIVAMTEISDDLNARLQIENDITRLQSSLAVSSEPNPQDLVFRAEVLGVTRSEGNYSDGRTKAEVAIKLGTTTTQLSKILRGKQILDVGGGTGVFANQVAKDKSVHVTVLDNDPAVLALVPAQSNIIVTEGNGYDLLACGLEADSFDAVFVTYATNFWAKSEEEIVDSVVEPFRVIRPGGSVFFTPVAQDVSVTEADLNGLMPDAYNLGLRIELGTERYRRYLKACGYHAIKTLQVVNALEQTGTVSAVYRTSSKNAGFSKMELPGNRLVRPESYSVILTRNPL